MTDDIFDFGFTAVDETELEVVQKAHSDLSTAKQTPRPAAAQPSTRTDTQTGKGAVVLDRQPARPLCLVSCRAPATCRRRHVTETEPTTPRASHPVRTLHQTAPGDRSTPSFVCGIEKCHVGDRDRLFGSSFSTSTGHRKRNPRALRTARALPSGASLSARETASEGAGRSQLTESGKHYLTTTVHPSTETTAVAIPRNL